MQTDPCLPFPCPPTTSAFPRLVQPPSPRPSVSPMVPRPSACQSVGPRPASLFLLSPPSAVPPSVCPRPRRSPPAPRPRRPPRTAEKAPATPQWGSGRGGPSPAARRATPGAPGRSQGGPRPAASASPGACPGGGQVHELPAPRCFWCPLDLGTGDDIFSFLTSPSSLEDFEGGLETRAP